MTVSGKKAFEIPIHCDGFDSPTLFDDFDAWSLDAAVWSGGGVGDGSVTSAYASSPGYSLNLGGGLGNVTTVVLDTTAFAVITWAYDCKRGPESPDPTEYLRLEYWSGSAWVRVDSWEGAAVTDATFSLRSGSVTATSARHAAFQARLIRVVGQRHRLRRLLRRRLHHILRAVEDRRPA